MVVTAGSYEEIPKIIHRPGKTYLVYGTPVISACSSQEAVCDQSETTDSKWLSPKQALELHQSILYFVV